MANQFIPANQLDFLAYKASLKTFLQQQSQFTDYDFEGSNLAAMVDLLAYNAYNQAHYLNMVGSEMFLDTSLLRESIVSHAKELNYTPRSRISARVNVSVEITPNDSPVSITIPRYYGFKTTSSTSNTVRFITDQPIVISRDANNRYISEPFTIYEGYLVTETFDVEQTSTVDGSVIYNQRFDLKSSQVDVTSIVVSVQTDENDTNPTIFTRAYDLYGLDGDSNVFFVRGYKDNYYEIEFGDGILGAALQQGQIVTVKYRDTVGSEGNGTFVFAKTLPIDGYSTVAVTTITRATGGSERETDEAIKYNATRHFQTQNRAVIESDYESLIRANFPEVQQVNTYGGELIYQYGKVIIVLKPHSTEGVVDDATKARIVAFLKTKNMVPEPVIEDPQYFYLGITGTAYYNLAVTSLREAELKTALVEALIGLNDSFLNDFDVDVYQSKIASTIVGSQTAIVGADVVLTVKKRWAPSAGQSTSLNFTIDNQIISSIQGEYTSTARYAVTTNVFQMILDDQIKNVVLRDNGIGEIFIHIVEDNDTLVKYTPSIGTVDYDSGEITVTIDPYSYNQYIDFTCRLTGESVNVTRNKFVLIDSADISITMAKQ